MTSMFKNKESFNNSCKDGKPLKLLCLDDIQVVKPWLMIYKNLSKLTSDSSSNFFSVKWDIYSGEPGRLQFTGSPRVGND